MATTAISENHKIVSQDEWQRACREFLKKEKELTRLGDEVPCSAASCRGPVSKSITLSTDRMANSPWLNCSVIGASWRHTTSCSAPIGRRAAQAARI